MKFGKILESVTETFSKVRLGGRRSDPKLAALDRGVLTVALLLAALDGEIFPEEYAAFEKLARGCRGNSAKNVRELHDTAFKLAGPLMAMAQSGFYSEKDRLASFLWAAVTAMPKGFADGSLADLRRAFVLWVTIGVSDGEFSKIERTALETLSWRFAAVRAERRARKGAPKSSRLLEMDFLEKAEQAVRGLAVPTRREKSEAVLAELIATVPEDLGGQASFTRQTTDLLAEYVDSSRGGFDSCR